jgi:HAE1 family hydrophobic/amphiphilic exporter-1
VDIYTFSIRRPVTVTVITLALIVISLLFSSKLNIEDFPKIEVPIISVSTIYKGAGPKEIEEQVSMRIEEAVGSIGNIKQIESVSQDSNSTVIIEFNYGTNMVDAAADVREKLDRIKRDLPTGSESPIVVKADPSDSPVIKLTLSDKSNNLRRLRSIADNEVKKSLEKLGGIASVKISGGIERAIVVNVNRDKIQALNIPIQSIAQAITRENNDIPVGRITADRMEFSVRTIGQLQDPKDFDNILVANLNGKAIYLKDVATVADDQKEVRIRNRNNGKPCVTLDVRKNTDANVVVVADAVIKAAEEINKTLPEGYELKVAYDKLAGKSEEE